MILLAKSRFPFWLQLLLALTLVVSGWFYGLKISTMGLEAMGKAIPPFVDLFPAWYGTREVVLHHGDPYSDEVTAQIQKAIYDRTASSGMDQQRFAYPVFSVILFFPFALAPLPLAEKLAFLVFVALTVASIAWWTGKMTARRLLLATLLAAATFPCYYVLIALQPTLLIASAMAAACAAARRGRLLLSGVLLALACVKPQLAIGILIPLFAWAIHDIRRRWTLPLAFLGAGVALFAFGQLILPGWVPEWLGVVRAYAGYARATSAISSLGRLPGTVLAVAIVAAVAIATWRHRDDLPFTSALCVSTVLLVVPLHLYDQFLLLVPALWLFANRDCFAEWTGQRLLALLDIALTIGWVWQVLLVPVYFLSRHAALILWGLPFGLIGVLPFTAFLPLFYRAFWIGRGQPAQVQELAV
ncbi:MAG: glycosyltransferase 87 family protein [Terracidiphilus sp.]